LHFYVIIILQKALDVALCRKKKFIQLNGSVVSAGLKREAKKVCGKGAKSLFTKLFAIVYV
jgi:hypothetical protein